MAEGMSVTLDLTGFGAFQAAVAAEVAQAVAAAAEAVVNDAKERAPVATGHMRDSTLYEMVTPTEAEVRAEADYSLWVDEGTVKAPAQPWFTPAVEAERARFAERIAAAVAEAMKP